MGPDIDTNIGYFGSPGNRGVVAQAGTMRRLQLGDFKLFGSMFSPAPWLVTVSSGNTYSGSTYRGAGERHTLAVHLVGEFSWR